MSRRGYWNQKKPQKQTPWEGSPSVTLHSYYIWISLFADHHIFLPSIQLCPSTMISRDIKLPHHCSSLGNNVSIKVQIDPRHPKMLPECCLLGAEHGRHFSYLQISLFISIQLLLRFPACERQLVWEELVPPSRALVFQLPPYISAHAVNALLHLDRTATAGAAELTARNMFAAQCAFRFRVRWCWNGGQFALFKPPWLFL